MTIRPEQIRDYEACARYYDFKHNDKIKVRSNSRSLKSQTFLDTVYRVASFYVFKKQSYEDPSLTSLLNRWQKDWYGPETKAIDLAKAKNSVQQNSQTAYSTRAIETLKLFYEDFSDLKADELFWLNEEYVVPITDKKIPLGGKADLVTLRKRSKQIDIYQWGHTTISLDEWKYNLIGTEMALRHHHDLSEYTFKHHIWSFLGNSIGKRTFTLEQKDFDLMMYWLEQMQDDEIYASRFGHVVLCKTCPYAGKCNNWKFPKKEVADE
jgi:hypothetical protein